MAEDWQLRTRMLIGDRGIERLASARVVVAGAGGVGGYAAEMLVRAGLNAKYLHSGCWTSTLISTWLRCRNILLHHIRVTAHLLKTLDRRLLFFSSAEGR